MMATMMQDKTANPMSFLPFLYKADDSDNISLEALYLFNYIYEHGSFFLVCKALLVFRLC